MEYLDAHRLRTESRQRVGCGPNLADRITFDRPARVCAIASSGDCAAEALVGRGNTADTQHQRTRPHTAWTTDRDRKFAGMCTGTECPDSGSATRARSPAQNDQARIGRSGAWSGFDALDGGHQVDRSVERGDASDAGALGAGHEVGLGEVETVDLVHLDCA